MVIGIILGQFAPTFSEKAVPMKNLFLRAILEMMFKFVDIIIWTAPIGVCFAIADAIGSNGLSALGSLGALVGTPCT